MPPPRLPRIVLTVGDINGIGPEVMMKALADPEVHERCQITIVGSRHLLAAYSHRTQCGPIEHTDEGIAAGGRIVPVIDIPTETRINFGEIDARAGKLAGDAILQAVRMVAQGEFEAVVTMPISKKALNAGGYDFPGHTELIAATVGGTPLMILMTSGMRVALATAHLPIAEVSNRISWTLVETSIRALLQSLRSDFGIDRPRVAVLGLNPHAGEHGTIGREEAEIISPTVDRLIAEGLDVTGPVAADGFFARFIANEYDAILAMYHDQGLIPLKMLARGSGVNFTAGLPVIRTSPDHGTAFSIAGLGIADEHSVVQAIASATEIVAQRKIYRS